MGGIVERLHGASPSRGIFWAVVTPLNLTLSLLVIKTYLFAQVISHKLKNKLIQTEP
jgi:hypothetical protein